MAANMAFLRKAHGSKSWIRHTIVVNPSDLHVGFGFLTSPKLLQRGKANEDHSKAVSPV